MHIFLTSSPTGSLDGSYKVDGIDKSNGFVKRLKRVWKENSRCLMITAFPSDTQASEQMTDFFHQALEYSGFSISCFDLWDDRTEDFTKQTLHSYDAVFLGGGHVPTQAAFFERIDLRGSMKGYEGIVVGISAGSMNAAELVYSEPELEGEALDPLYKRFFPGLGLTKYQVIPHYQMVKDDVIDGLRLFEDITIPDGAGQHFVVIPDGSFIQIEDGSAVVCGPSWIIRDAGLVPFTIYGQDRELERPD